MKGKVFLDSNILIYAHTDIDLAKQVIAQKAILGNKTWISTQVLQEISNVLHKKFKKTWNEVKQVLVEAKTNSDFHLNSDLTVLKACRIADRYGFSFYDSLVIAAALEIGCSILYSEDFQDGQIIEGKLKIVNLFVPE